MIAAQQAPDHAPIARFVDRHEHALAELFGSVLALCAQERIAREILDEAKAIDAAEDELYGEARGDEPPPEFATDRGRKKWLSEAKRRLDDQRAVSLSCSA